VKLLFVVVHTVGFFPSYSLPMKKKWMKNENGWLNCPISGLSLARKHCVRVILRNARKIKIKTSRSNQKHAKKKNRTFRRTKKPENHLPKQNTKNLMDEKFQKSTRL